MGKANRLSIQIGKHNSVRDCATIRRLLPVLLGVAVVLAALIAFGPLAGVAQAVSYNAEEAAFVKLINDYRVGKGLEPLLVSDALSEAGDRHSSDMGKYRYFSHTTAGSDWFSAGASPYDRMALSGYGYNTWKGENLAAGMSTAAQAFTGWKNSSGHNANMLNSNFKVMGVSLVVTSGSPYTHYWTTDFGGYVDPTARSIGSTQPTSTTTTVRPTTTTVRPTTTTTAVRPTTTTTTAQRPNPPLAFSDVTSATPYAAAIGLLAKQGVVSGYPDGTFRSEQPVSRQQIAKMIALTAGYRVTLLAPCGFVDVEAQLDAGDPFYPRAYIAACAAHGVVEGRTSDLFAPYDPVTRAQIITMVARAAQLPAPSPSYVAPFGEFSPEHYPWALRAAEAGLLDGLLGMGRAYEFWKNATRGEVCEVLAQLLR